MIGTPLSQKDAELIAQYYRDHFDHLYKYALRLLRDTSCAEVAVQETFLIATRRIDKLRESERPVGWLYQTLKYVIKAMERDRAEVLLHCVSLDDVVVSGEELEVPEALDENLPDLKLLKRFYVDGYKLSELAKEYGTTVPALKMRISRAKKRLREDPNIKKLRDSFD